MQPKLQLAMDTLDGIHALSLAQRCAPNIDILEAGTPLIKSVGISIVSQLRALFSNKLILADLKSSDVGAYEAEMAFRAGADIATTQGITTLATVLEVQRAANEAGKMAEVDMTGVANPLELAKVLQQKGVKLVLMHRSIDEETTSGVLWDDKALKTVAGLIDLGLLVAVAGGIGAKEITRFAGLPLYAIVLGRSITAAADPAAAAAEMRQIVQQTWAVHHG